MVVSDKVDGKMMDGPVDQLEQALVRIINAIALDFLDVRMKGKRGKENEELSKIATILVVCQVLFNRRDEPLYKLNLPLGFCFQKLTNVSIIIAENLTLLFVKLIFSNNISLPN
jgi:hypothetical protein